MDGGRLSSSSAPWVPWTPYEGRLGVFCSMLHLIRSSGSRPSGKWSDDDDEVFNHERHIGQIVWCFVR